MNRSLVASLLALNLLGLGCGAEEDLAAADVIGESSAALSCGAVGSGFACTMSSTEVATLLQTALAGTSAYIDTDSSSGSARSYVALGAALGGATQYFHVAAHTVSLGFLGVANFAVDDIGTSGSPTVARSGSSYRVRFAFEDSGREIDSWHSGRVVSLGDGAIPDVDMTSIQTDILFAPVSASFGNRIYGSATADFSANIQALGICNINIKIPFAGNITIDVCNIATNYRSKIETAVESGLSSFFSTTTTRDRLSDAFWVAVASRVPSGYHAVSVTFNASLDATITIAH